MTFPLPASTSRDTDVAPMRTAPQDDNWTLLSPERPPPPPKLAFVPYDQSMCEGGETTGWWPAIVYSSYGQAIDERYESLALETKNRFVRNMYEKHCARRRAYLMTGDPTVIPEDTNDDNNNNTTMHVAQLLGFQDLWIEFDATQQKGVLAYVLQAMGEREKLPLKIQKVYDVAIEQLKLLLTFDPRSSHGSTTTKSIDDIVSTGAMLHLNTATATHTRKSSTSNTFVNTNDTRPGQQSEPSSASSSNSRAILTRGDLPSQREREPERKERERCIRNFP